jgi:hypothetical protein
MYSVNSINAKDIKEQVSIVDLLARLGFQPARSTGKEKIYLSMIRDSDTAPSFTVNDNLNVWYDHGLGKGGNVIDFGLRYWPHLSFPEVLEKLNEVAALPANRTDSDSKPKRPRAVKIPHYEIEEIKELGSNPVITEYLQNRGIYNQALPHLKEVYYYVEDEKKLRKQFYAAGWQNELGSWEVRNQYFKGCLGHKAITFIPRDPEKLAIFEGFINYLSWQSEHPLATESILVLNTATLVFAATKKARDFQQVALYLDRENVGYTANLNFIKEVSHAKDCSSIYDGYNDYNEMLMSKLKSNPDLNTLIHKIRR